MQLNNETRYSPFLFESFDHDDSPVNVVLCRGTFDIRNGERLTEAGVMCLYERINLAGR